MNLRSLLRTTSAVGVVAAAASQLVAPTAAHAQSGANNAQANNNIIIVQARKRDEEAIKVPVIQTVVTEAVIERQAITDLQSIANVAPGVVVGESALSNGTQVSIRGIGTNSLDPGVDNSVALVIDGFSFSQGLAYQSGTFDLAQIEVLKGPQSLFFGKASPAGVISIRTADPGDEMELIARGGYEHEAREGFGELIFSTPLGDDWGIRLAGRYSKSDGFFYNANTNATLAEGGIPVDNRIGGAERWQVRGTVTFDPSDEFNARLKVNYVNDLEEIPGHFQMALCPDGNGSQGAGLPQPLNPLDDCVLDRTTYAVGFNTALFASPTGTGFPTNSDVGPAGTPYGKREQLYSTLEMNFDFIDDITLTSVSGLWDLKSEVLFNTFQTQNLGPVGASPSFIDRDEFTQEFRVNSDFDGPIDFTAGAFYQTADILYDQSLQVNQANIAQVNAANAAAANAGNPPPFPVGGFITSSLLTPDGQLSNNTGRLNIETWSLFGQLRFSPTPEFEISAGGRYSDETRRSSYTNNFTNTFTIAPTSINSKTFSPEVTLSYFPNDDLTLFASYKKGYKSGSFSLSAVRAGVLDNSFGDESTEGVEGGLKARLFDGQMALNLGAYYYEFEGLQFSTSEAQAAGQQPTVRVVNAGAARIYGLEMDASFQPRGLEGLTISAAANYNNSKFTELNGIPCYTGQSIAQGCSEGLNNRGAFTAQGDLAGFDLPRAPEFTATLGWSYEVPLPGDWSLMLSNDNRYSSSYLTNVGANARDYRQDEFVKVDAGLFIRGPEEKWELGLIGKNLTNQITTSTCSVSNFANNFLDQSDATGRNQSDPSSPPVFVSRDGIGEVGCIAERGRSVLLRLTVRPFGR